MTNRRVLYRRINPIGAAESVISGLSPTAWYHMRGSGVPTSSGGFASMWPDMADTDNGLVLNGVASNTATTPDSAALSITGDCDFRVFVRLSDYSPSSYTYLLAKWVGGSTSYIFALTTSGLLEFNGSADGSVVSYAIASSSAVPTTGGDAVWLRMTRVASTGSTKFYTSSNGTDWIQLGNTVSTAAGNIFDGTAPLAIGSINASNSPLVGSVYRAVIYSDTTETTKVLDADFSAQAKGTTSFTESSSNAATVTVNQSGALPAHIGNAKDLLQGTGTNQPAYSAGVITFDGVDNYLKTNAFTLNQGFTVYAVLNQVSWTAFDHLVNSGATTNTGIFQNGSTPNLSLYAGSTINSDPDPAVGSFAIMTAVFNGAASRLQTNNNAAVSGDGGATGMTGLTLGAQTGGASAWSNVAYKEFIAFSSAHDAATRTSVINALNTLNTVF